ncbi:MULTISPECIES: hydantoinase/oxoprolinase N-terminal domain-containing protein [unclassified Streptomyces]|uniref:hydantoinase/oxoprolinase N-terminal domain-containing protein n=1 Tax=unclassified Streptomyces TaxID=2593676 RepID=UPI00338FD145
MGGTCTNCVVLDDQSAAPLQGAAPSEPAVGVTSALAHAEADLVVESSGLFDRIHYFGLGATVATTVLIECKGVKTEIITT